MSSAGRTPLDGQVRAAVLHCTASGARSSRVRSPRIGTLHLQYTNSIALAQHALVVRGAAYQKS